MRNRKGGGSEDTSSKVARQTGKVNVYSRVGDRGQWRGKGL